jgi:hypothetical protein
MNFKEHGMSTFPPNRPLVKGVSVKADTLDVEYADGRVATIKRSLSPRLRQATDAQIRHWELIAGGVGVHWPDIDEDLSAETFIREAISVAEPPAAATA